MRSIKPLVRLPAYAKKYPLEASLPTKVRDWSHGRSKSLVVDKDIDELTRKLKHFNKINAWKWPARTHLFFSDLHGDAETFAESLVASGGVRKTGPFLMDFDLTEKGRKAVFIIGGDTFDKGPSTLTLLRLIRYLIDLGAKVQILAGNHDVRVKLGMLAVGTDAELHNEHFFVRTGPKIVPLLKEIAEQYVDKKMLNRIPDRKTVKKYLFPRNSWFDDFPGVAKAYLTEAQIQRELVQIEKKMLRFEKACEKSGISLKQAYAATQLWKALFLEPDGEFYWFYKRMRLVMQAGSLLFVHAGLDNKSAKWLLHEGASNLNRQFRKAMKKRPQDFYYGPLCNMIRTKYRDQDHALSSQGTRYVRRAGITAIVHGHRNLCNGQRMALRKGLISFECDVTLDRHSRKKEGLSERGAGVTIVDPKGFILGISSDYPFAKFFHPHLTFQNLDKHQSKQKSL